MAIGYIKLYRQFLESNLWQEKREFSKAEAWMDLLMNANYEDKEVLFGNLAIECKRGQLLWSLQTMSSRWGWGIKKGRLFLDFLQKSEMIVREDVKKTTRITICKYDYYQSEGQAKGTSRAGKGHIKGIRGATTKEDKEDKEIKEDILSGIVEYLNQKLNTNYKPDAKSTITHIQARLNDGYTYEDFKKVIDYKTKEWRDTEMAKFLRPETLFSPKFENYLNSSTLAKENKFNPAKLVY